MNARIALLSLYRSPQKTAVTLLLLVAAAFLLLYNLSEYSVADQEYREARNKYEGVLTVEEWSVPDHTGFDLYLLSDETGRNSHYGESINENYMAITYENFHQESLGNEIFERLASLPHISRVEKRYLTAGVSRDYIRLDTDYHYYPFDARCILTATVQSRFFSNVHDNWGFYSSYYPELESVEYLILEDVELLAGNPAWLVDPISGREYEEFAVDLQTVKEVYKESGIALTFHIENTSRNSMFTTENAVFPEDAAILEPGRRYLLVLRNDTQEENPMPSTQYEGIYPNGLFHQFEVGDDFLEGWWPYFVDITEAPDNWLELEEYADLRELIRVTNDDVHTFDMVYCDDMAAQRRVADGRIVCEAGRFITPEDAGQPVCVVSTDFLDTYGLAVGDTLTLDLGNYLSEQYAPLGAVAATRGRQNTEYTTQTFTIVGAWRDLNEGNHPYRDRFWCWSNNAIFIPTTFLPECRNAEGHTFKPSEVSFVVGNAEEIPVFVEECLPLVEKLGLTYQFSEGGWLQVASDLTRARSLARVKLLIFTGVAFFALLLTVWLFIGRKKREYGILRALGMPKREAGAQLFLPFLLLGLVSAILGLLAAWLVTGKQLAVGGTHPPVSPLLFLLGTLGFLALLAAQSFGGLLLIRRESILELVQEKQK